MHLGPNGGTGEASSGNSNQSFSRLSRIDFPRFGGEDVLGWIYRCEQFFEVDHTAEDVQVKIASIHLTGKALLWHQSFMKNRVRGDWPLWGEYKTAITTHFGAKPFDDPFSELMKLRQQGTVGQYQERFNALLTQVNMPRPYAVSCFLSRLVKEIQTAVRMFKPNTLHDAYCLVVLQEAILASISKRTRPIL